MDFTPMSWDQIKASQKSARVRAYESYRAKLNAILASPEKSHQAIRQQFGSKVLALTPGAVHTDRALDNLAIAYANEEYIGDQIIPAVPVSNKSDEFWVRSRRDFTGYPDDSIAGEGRAPRINKELTTDNYQCKDHGLSDFIQQATIDNQDAVLDEMANSTETVSEGLAFKREQRQKTLLTTAANFDGNTTSVTAWSASGTLGGNPIADIKAARANVWNGRGRTRIVGYCSLDVYDVLSRHSSLLELFKYGAGPVNPDGLVTPQMIARVFDLDTLYVGRAWEDTANEGQTASFGRMWPDVFGIARVMEGATRRNNAGFAARFEWKKPQTTIEFDRLKGVSGGYDIQVTNSDVDKVVGAPTGYLLTGVIT